MPLSASTAWKAHLASDPTTMAFCVRMQRSDGWIGGFTNDVNGFDLSDSAFDQFGFNFGSTIRTYRPDDAIAPSTMTLKAGMSPENVNIEFLIDEDGGNGITERDIIAGLFHNAEVITFTINFMDIGMGVFEPRRCYVGDVEIDGQVARFEVNSQSTKCEQAMGELTRGQCRVRQLGDARCGFNLAGNTVDGFPATVTGKAITAAPSKRQFTVSSLSSYPEDYYRYGRVKFETGQNAELWAQVEKFDSGVFTLRFEQFLPFEVGDTITAITGCNRLFSTCWGKFNNARRFAGEPKGASLESSQRVN